MEPAEQGTGSMLPAGLKKPGPVGTQPAALVRLGTLEYVPSAQAAIHSQGTGTISGRRSNREWAKVRIEASERHTCGDGTPSGAEVTDCAAGGIRRATSAHRPGGTQAGTCRKGLCRNALVAAHDAGRAGVRGLHSCAAQALYPTSERRWESVSQLRSCGRAVDGRANTEKCHIAAEQRAVR
eukprot:7379324-Prymnesium_polylepis.2